MSEKYIGTFALNPTPEQASFTQGTIFFDSTAAQMKVYDGMNWVAAYTGTLDNAGYESRLTALEEGGGGGGDLTLTSDGPIVIAPEEFLTSFPIGNAPWFGNTTTNFANSAGATLPSEWGDAFVFHSDFHDTA